MFPDQLRALHDEIRACRRCEADFGFPPRPVVFGSAHAKIVQISQAPSRTVHRTGRPFDDASGRRLRAAWYRIPDAAFYDPALFYIVSIAHCYPGKNPHGGDRPPPRACADRWLARELALVENELYVLVGAAAAAYFFPGQPLTPLVFRDLAIGGKPAFVLPHPSPLNTRWLREHPAFEAERLPVVRAAVHAALGLP